MVLRGTIKNISYHLILSILLFGMGFILTGNALEAEPAADMDCATKTELAEEAKNRGEEDSNIVKQIEEISGQLTEILAKIKGNSDSITKNSGDISALTTKTSDLPKQLDTPDRQYKLGERGPAGGIVFYITPNGMHGMEVAPSDQGTATWGCFPNHIRGADGTEVGSGEQNTLDIITACLSTGIAARVANSCVYGDETDWFLPSEAEMELIASVGALESDVAYWTSTEGAEAGSAIRVSLSSTGTVDVSVQPTNTTMRVRPARSFF